MGGYEVKLEIQDIFKDMFPSNKKYIRYKIPKL